MFFGKTNNNSRSSASINGFTFNFDFPTANFSTNFNPHRISSSLSNLLSQSSKSNPSEILVCEGCGTKFHFLKKKRTCIDCCMNYCASCFPRDVNNDCSASKRGKCKKCRIFNMNPMDRNSLMSLKVKDLRWFLNKRQIYTNYCKEKSDLVDLIIQNNEGQTSVGFRTTNPYMYNFNLQTSANLDPSVNNTRNSNNRFNNFNNFETNERELDEVSQSSQTSQVNSPSLERQNLSVDKKETNKGVVNASDFKLFNINDLKTEEEILNLSVRQIKLLLTRNFVDYKGCCEKEELFKKALCLWKDFNKNKNKDSEELDDSNACKICMERAADCVLLECGHVITCIECGKKMNECPICRQYVVRVLRIYKS